MKKLFRSSWSQSLVKLYIIYDIEELESCCARLAGMDDMINLGLDLIT